MTIHNRQEELVLGILGGMGTYATIHLFKQYAECFSAEKEWDRPRIIIDNRCTMPSRVRAYIYNEKVDLLIEEMTDSIRGLLNCGATRIILDCNTSHLFLPEILRKYPSFSDKIVDVIKTCSYVVSNAGIKKIYLLASEGTIESGIYQKELGEYGIECVFPVSHEYESIRKCIEAVKQNRYEKETEDLFIDMINRYDSCILGCTELPVLYERYRKKVLCRNIFDPIQLTLQKIRGEFYGD